MTAVTTSRIEVDGLGLVVDQAGIGGRPLLFVHGFCGWRDDATPIIPALVEAGWHVAVADNRGHGESDQPADEGAYTLDAFAGDALGVADALGWERFALIGHSLGGMIAQRLAIDVPHRLDALVLMNTTDGPLPIESGKLAGAAAVVRRDGLDRLIELLEASDDPMGSPAHARAVATIPGYADRGARNIRRSSPAMYAAVMDLFGATPDRSAALAAAGLACPTLVIVGEEDATMLPGSRRLADTIAGARLVVLPDAGHAPQFEATGAFVGALVGFLDSV